MCPHTRLEQRVCDDHVVQGQLGGLLGQRTQRHAAHLELAACTHHTPYEMLLAQSIAGPRTGGAGLKHQADDGRQRHWQGRIERHQRSDMVKHRALSHMRPCASFL